MSNGYAGEINRHMKVKLIFAVCVATQGEAVSQERISLSKSVPSGFQMPGNKDF